LNTNNCLFPSCRSYLVQLLCIVEYQTRCFAGVIEMLRWFAGCQIRNVAVSMCV